MDRLRWWLLGSAVPVGAACTIAAGAPGAEAVGDLALAALGLATAAVLWAAGRSKQPRRRGWRLIAVAPLLPVAGLLAVTVVAPDDPVEQVALRWLPIVLAYVLVVVGTLTLVAPSRLRRGARAVVELALFLIACVLVVQVLVLGPDLDWLDLTPSGRAVIAAAVVATSAAMAAALLLLGVIESRRQSMALVLLAATALLASGRALVTSATLTTGEEVAGDLGRFLVAGGMVLLGAAVLLDPGPCPDAGPSPGSGRSTEMRQLLPHLAMTVACLGAAAVSLTGHRISPVTAIGGSVCASLAVLHRWMTAREEQRVNARVRRSEAYFRSLVAASGDAVLILDRGLRVTWSSPTLGTMLGALDAAPVGADLLELVHPDDAASVVAALRPDGGDAAPPGVLPLRLRHADGSWRHLEAGLSDLRSDAVVGAVVLHCRDTTERVERERTLEQLAFTDPVTGLPNRAGCERGLADALAAGGSCRSLLLVELDGLDEVREDAGHDVVTSVLVEIGRRLRATVRSGDLVSRVGGGAFAVLADGPPHSVDLLADRCLSVIEQPLDTPAGVFDLSAGIGVVDLGAADSVADLMVRAELAVRAAATSGTGSALRYRPALGSAAERRARLREDLPGAWDRGELSVLFQPVVSLGEQRVTGVEALLRWQHPELGEVPPAEFVPIAERAGVIGELQRWALETAATVALTLPHTGEPLRLGVNISASHVAARTLVRDVAAVLQSTGLAPERLILEITEATLMSEGEHVAVDFEALRLMGVHVALDDFGTGRSSLAHLTRLPIDVLKLDHVFVLRVDRDPKARALCESVVAIAAALGLDVVAEGVETPAQLNSLRAAGCGFAQGFLLARPMRPQDLADVLDDGAGLLWPGLVGSR